jgi:tetratricopeptide (TPR) repeat protein
MNQTEHYSFNYNAFISYRHLPLDQAVAKKLHTLLETYRLPCALTVQGFPGWLRRVFRDEEELPTAGVLTDSIRQALEQSGWLLVICTPDTPLSRYVLLEIQIFIGLGRADRIMALLVKGEPERSVPEILREIPGFETRILDLRSSKTGQTIRRLAQVMPRIIAACLGCTDDELRREDIRRGHRLFLVGSAAIAALLVFSGLFCYFQWRTAELARQRAKVEKDGMMQVIKSLTYTLPEKMKDISYTYPPVAKVLEQNLQTLDEIMDLNGDSNEALREKAMNYLKLESAWEVLGDHRKACNLGRDGLKIFQNLAKDKTDKKAQVDLTAAYRELGDGYRQGGFGDYAIENYRKAIFIFENLGKMNKREQESLAMCYYWMANLYSFSKKDDDNAIECFQKCLKILENLTHDKDTRSAFASDYHNLWNVYNDLANIYNYMGETDQAFDYQQKCLRISTNLARDKRDRTAQFYLASDYSNLGYFYCRIGDKNNGFKYIQKSLSITEDLASDKTNKMNQRSLAIYYLSRGFISGDHLDEAIHYYHKAKNIQESLAKDKTNKFAQEFLLICYNMLGNAYCSKKSYDDAMHYYQRALIIQENLAKDKMDKGIQGHLAAIYSGFGDVYCEKGAYNDAINYYQKALRIREILTKKTNKKAQWQWSLHYSYISLALVYLRKGDCDNAISYYQKGLIIQESNMEFIKNRSFKHFEMATFGANCVVLGSMYGANGENGKELKYFQKSVTVHEQLKNSLNHNDDNYKKVKPILSSLYGLVVRDKLFTGDKDYASIKQLALKGLEYGPDQLLIKVYLGHVYLLNGEYDQAVKTYLSIKDVAKADGQHTYKDDILNDFAILRSKGVTCPDMEKVEQLLKQ